MEHQLGRGTPTRSPHVRHVPATAFNQYLCWDLSDVETPQTNTTAPARPTARPTASPTTASPTTPVPTPASYTFTSKDELQTGGEPVGERRALRDGHVRPHLELGHGPHHGHVELFKDKDTFNDDISSWVRHPSRAWTPDFSPTPRFNQPIGSWNIFSVQSTFNAERLQPALGIQPANRHVEPRRSTQCGTVTSMYASACSTVPAGRSTSPSARGTSTRSPTWRHVLTAPSFNQDLTLVEHQLGHHHAVHVLGPPRTFDQDL